MFLFGILLVPFCLIRKDRLRRRPSRSPAARCGPMLIQQQNLQQNLQQKLTADSFRLQHRLRPSNKLLGSRKAGVSLMKLAAIDLFQGRVVTSETSHCLAQRVRTYTY